MVYLRGGSARCTVRHHPNRVLREKRRDAGRVVPVESLVKLRSQRTNLLGYYQAYFHYLLSGGKDDLLSDDPLRALLTRI
jgi:hypothetical protein